LVGWPDGMPMQLEKPIVLEDALSDLPEKCLDPELISQKSPSQNCMTIDQGH
jgi:hypothetical protein